MRVAARRDGSEVGVAELDGILSRLRAGGWVHITVTVDGRPAYSIEPYRCPPDANPDDHQAEGVLSRFAVMRRSGAGLLIESPRSWCAIRIHDADTMVALAALSGAHTATPATPLTRRLISDLTWAGMLVQSPADEDTIFELCQWSPFELWFHQRTRGEGTPDAGFGRTRWASGRFEPIPARRPSCVGPVVDLPAPDLDALRDTDLTLTTVLETRRSIRRHDDERPITLDQIGEFLYRAAAVRQLYSRDGIEFTTGPNPAGGALDSLEFYLAARLVAGLEPGLYRYDRFGHCLESISGFSRLVHRLVVAAQNATGSSTDSGQTHPPQLVVLIAARFGRVGWSYETLPYSLILKHVGVTFQTMYCVATAMGLAPCALGAGDSATFAELTGLNPLVESTVGEFILGSRPAVTPGGPNQ
jgi:SagB-type dehydrogenase family enzyme